MNKPVRPLTAEELVDVLAFANDATAIHVGEDAVIQFANKAMLTIWGKGDEVIGKSLEAALPELRGQPFIEMFARVWREGITITGKDSRADLEINGTLQTFYFDHEYRAMLNSEGKTYCILHMARDVTATVLSRNKEQSLLEELTAVNEELLASNEEINSSNDELLESRRQLLVLYDNLTESDGRFRTMVRQAPAGICIIRADDLLVQEVNDAYLELVGKPRELFQNLTIWEILPEAADTYAPVMNRVITTGERFTAKEHEVTLVRKGVPEQVFVDFVYEPLHSDQGIHSIMVLAIDVTDKVIARRKIEEIEERIRLAIEASEIAPFELDYKNSSLQTTERFYAIFGFKKEVPWNKIIGSLHPDDRLMREDAHKNAFITGKLNYEARAVYPDASVHWVRINGNVKLDSEGRPIRLLGTVLDITEFKMLEQQKDDFISIASHELKTPLTSLKASLQLLERLKDNPASPMLPKLIDQSVKSMQKVTTLVDDLLNVGKTKATHLTLNKTTFNVADLMDNCCNHVRVEGKYHLTFKGDKAVTVNADEHAIDQVLINLVNNAVKYAPESYEIILSVERLPHAVKMAVSDKGPGIAPDKIPHLFDRYYQAQAAGFNNSGWGLGLFISAGIIKKHGGQIGVESELGRGSTFWFTLPV